MPYPIIIDYTGPGRKSEPESIRKLLGDDNIIEADLYKLFKAGDYLMFTKDGYTVGLERKEAKDLFGSMKGGSSTEPSRLIKQLDNLSEAFDFPVLAITGNIERSIDGKVVANGRRLEWWYNYYSMWQWRQTMKLWILADDIAFAKGLLMLRVWLAIHNVAEVSSMFSSCLGVGLHTVQAQQEFNWTKGE